MISTPVKINYQKTLDYVATFQTNLGHTEEASRVISSLLMEIEVARAEKLWSEENLGYTPDQYHELDTFPNFLPSRPSDIADEANLWL
jgi:hypothetical protein